MKLTGIHFLLTYTCNYECDHCFLYCSPYTPGTFTIQQVEAVLQEAQKIGTIQTIYFEGGEPTLYYSLLLESIRRAHQKGFEVGIVTNAYGALAEEDALLWLRPLADLGAISTELLVEHVRLATQVRREMPFAQEYSEAVWAHYVLAPRVSQDFIWGRVKMVMNINGFSRS